MNAKNPVANRTVVLCRPSGAWLGHVSINTTNIYAETDLEMKAKALGMCAVKGKRSAKHWRDNHDLMAFLAQI